MSFARVPNGLNVLPSSVLYEKRANSSSTFTRRSSESAVMVSPGVSVPAYENVRRRWPDCWVSPIQLGRLPNMASPAFWPSRMPLTRIRVVICDDRPCRT
jgi:hypothetical protein